MSIPLLDLEAQYRSIRKPVKAAINDVLTSQQFIMGEPVQLLEEEVRAYTGAKHAIACASGSDALLLSLMAMDANAEDLVLTTPYTFFATGGAVARLGATPVFLDIRPDDYNLDPNAVEDFLKKRHPLAKRFWKSGKKVRMMIPVHLYGQCAAMPELMQLAETHGLTIIEDAAQSIGAHVDGRAAGSMGTFGCFSFFPSKNLGAYGDAGLVTVNDDELAEKVRILRLHGSKPKYHHHVIGINSRLDTLQAAILRVKLPYLDTWSQARRDVAARYTKGFSKAGIGMSWNDFAEAAQAGNSTPAQVLEQNPDIIVIPSLTTGSPNRNGSHIFHQYVIRTSQREKIIEALNAASIGHAVYYPLPLHVQPCFSHLGYTENDAPEAVAASRQTLALPIYPELSKKDQKFIIQTIKEALTA